MPNEILTALIGLAGALIGGVISSGATIAIHRSEREKHRRERSWDLRRAAYTEIIGSIDRARAILECIHQGYEEDPHGYGASAPSAQASAQMTECLHVARHAFHANRLMLSRAFIGKYDGLNTELGTASESNLAPVEKAATAAEIAKRIVLEMEDLAASELGIAF